MQLYLKQMLETFLHPQSMVRLSALTVVNMILRQGLVHPVQVIMDNVQYEPVAVSAVSKYKVNWSFKLRISNVLLHSVFRILLQLVRIMNKG